MHRHRHVQTHKKPLKDRQTDKNRCMDTHRPTDANTHRHRDIQTDTNTDRQTHRYTDIRIANTQEKNI